MAIQLKQQVDQLRPLILENIASQKSNLKAFKVVTCIKWRQIQFITQNNA
jgi:hypothetical protein